MSRSCSRSLVKARSRNVEDFTSNQQAQLAEDPSANNTAMDVVMPLPPFLATSCYICKSVVDEDLTILCDGEGCTHEVHMYCLKPPLLTVPTANWYCHECDHYGASEPLRLYFDEHAATKAQHLDGSLESYEVYQSLLPASVLPMDQMGKSLFCSVERSEFEGMDLSGYMVEVYCPVDDVYHRGRIISKATHYDAYNTDEYLVLFRSGSDGRNVELQRVLCLSEHCCIAYTEVIMTFAPSHSSYGWIPVQTTFRSGLDLLLNNTTLAAVQQHKICYSFSEDKLVTLEDDAKIEKINDHRFRNRMTKAMAVAYSSALAEAEEQLSIQRAINVCAKSLENNCGLAFNITRPTMTQVLNLHTQAPKKKVVTYFTAEQDAKQQTQVTTDSVQMIKSEFLLQHAKKFNLSKSHSRSVNIADQSLVMLDAAYLAHEIDTSCLLHGRGQDVFETGVLLCSTTTLAVAEDLTASVASSASVTSSNKAQSNPLPLTLTSPWTQLQLQAQAIEQEEELLRQQQDEEKKRLKRENWYIARERLKVQREEEAQRRREKYEEKKKNRLLEMEVDDPETVDAVESKRRGKRKHKQLETDFLDEAEEAAQEQAESEVEDWMKVYGVRSPRAASIVAVDRITATANQGRHATNKLRTAAEATPALDRPSTASSKSSNKSSSKNNQLTAKQKKSNSQQLSAAVQKKGKVDIATGRKVKRKKAKKQRLAIPTDSDLEAADSDNNEEENDNSELVNEEQVEEQEQEADVEQLDSFVVELDTNQPPQAETQEDNGPQTLDRVHPHLWQDRLVRETDTNRLGRVVGKDASLAIVKLLSLSSSSPITGELVVVNPSLLLVIDQRDEEDVILQAEAEAAATAMATTSSVAGSAEEQVQIQQQQMQLQEDQTVISSISNDQVQDYGDALLMQHAMTIGENFFDPPATASNKQQIVMSAAKRRERASKIQYLDLSAYTATSSSAQTNVMARRPLLNSKLNPVAAPVAATATSAATTSKVASTTLATSATRLSGAPNSAAAPQTTVKEYAKFGRGSFKFSTANTATSSSTTAARPQTASFIGLSSLSSIPPPPAIDSTTAEAIDLTIEPAFSPIIEASPRQLQELQPAGTVVVVGTGGVRRSRFDPRPQRHQQQHAAVDDPVSQASPRPIVPSFSPVSSPRPITAAEDNNNNTLHHQQYLYHQQQVNQSQIPDNDMQLPPPATMQQDEGSNCRSSRSRTRFSRFDNPAGTNDYSQQQAQQQTGIWPPSTDPSYFQQGHQQAYQQQQWSNEQLLQQQQQQGYEHMLWQQQQQQSLYPGADNQHHQQRLSMSYNNSLQTNQSNSQYFQQPPVAPTLQVPTTATATQGSRKAIAIAPALPEQPSEGLTKAQRRRMKRSDKNKQTHLQSDVMENEMEATSSQLNMIASRASVSGMMTTRRGKAIVDEAEEGEVLDEE